jgi:hypothetical protein
MESVIKLFPVIPVGQTWQRAKKHQLRAAKQFMGFLRNGTKSFVIVDRSGDQPILEAADKKFPLMQTIDGAFIAPQLNAGLRIKLHDASGVIYKI